MKNYKKLFESDIKNKIIDTIYIEYSDPKQLKISRKGKTILVKLEGEEKQRRTFRDYLISMTKSINNKNYDATPFSKTITADLNRLSSDVVSILNVYNELVVSILHDNTIKAILDSEEYKRSAIESYKRNQ